MAGSCCSSLFFSSQHNIKKQITFVWQNNLKYKRTLSWDYFSHTIQLLCWNIMFFYSPRCFVAVLQLLSKGFIPKCSILIFMLKLVILYIWELLNRRRLYEYPVYGFKRRMFNDLVTLSLTVLEGQCYLITPPSGQNFLLINTLAITVKLKSLWPDFHEIFWYYSWFPEDLSKYFWLFSHLPCSGTVRPTLLFFTCKKYRNNSHFLCSHNAHSLSQWRRVWIPCYWNSPIFSD